MKKTKKLNARKLRFETIEGSVHNVITTGTFTKDYKEAVNYLVEKGLIEKATIDNEALTEEKIIKEVQNAEAVIVNPEMLWKYIREKAMDDRILSGLKEFLKVEG